MDQILNLALMSERTLIAIIGFVLMMAVVVFIHEFGHYYAARLCNVRVTDFSLGFGKKLFSRKDRNDTVWSLSLIPLGGYVKFSGDRSEASLEDIKHLNQLSEDEKKETFFFKAIWQKIFIIFAGPFANFILSFFILFCISFFLGVVSVKAIIGSVQSDSVASRNDIRKNDIFTHINDAKVDTAQDVQRLISKSFGDKISLTLVRSGKKITKVFSPDMVLVEGSQYEKKPVIGVTFNTDKSNVDFSRYNIVLALQTASKNTFYIAEVTVGFFKRIFTGQADIKQISGPLKIGDAAGAALKSGVWQFFLLMSFISMSVGIINLLPIPMLDGGHILFYLLEVVGLKPNEQLREFAFKLGFLLVIFVMMFALINDFFTLG